MKLVLSLSFLIFFFLSLSIAQKTTYPPGGYKTFDEFKAKQPSVHFAFRIGRRTRGDIVMNGGNDYKVSSDSVDRHMIRRELYAVSDGDTLYINCGPQKAQPWYGRAMTEGKFVVFSGGIGPLTNKHTSVGYVFGAVGGAVAGAQAALLRFLYVINTEDGQVILLDREFLEKILKAWPETGASYQAEPKKESEETLLKYIRIVNCSR